MKHLVIVALVIGLSGLSQACTNSTDVAASDRKSPDVADSIRQSLERASLHDVSVKQDRDAGVVTLTGTVATDVEKSQAEALARQYALNQVVANEIVVAPAGIESQAKDASDATDDAIAANVKAVLLKNDLDDDVRYDVKAGVVTLTGGVRSVAMRDKVEDLASDVENVKQVVNKLEVENPKATSSSR